MRQMEKILSDPLDELSKEELFERIVYKLKRKYQFRISDEEARAAARALTGFYQTLVELKQQIKYSE